MNTAYEIEILKRRASNTDLSLVAIVHKEIAYDDRIHEIEGALIRAGIFLPNADSCGLCGFTKICPFTSKREKK